jgi:hypothetical protein
MLPQRSIMGKFFTSNWKSGEKALKISPFFQ